MDDLKATIKREFRAIPEVMIKKAVFGMKSRAMKLVEFEGKAFEGKKIRMKAPKNVVSIMKLLTTIRNVTSQS